MLTIGQPSVTMPSFMPQPASMRGLGITFSPAGLGLDYGAGDLVVFKSEPSRGIFMVKQIFEGSTGNGKVWRAEVVRKVTKMKSESWLNEVDVFRKAVPGDYAIQEESQVSPAVTLPGPLAPQDLPGLQPQTAGLKPWHWLAIGGGAIALIGGGIWISRT